MLKYLLIVFCTTALSQGYTVKDDEVKATHDVIAHPFVVLGGKNYYFETNVDANWYEGKTFCRNLGLFLVSIETPEEMDLITEHLKTLGGRAYLTSGNDIAKPGAYVWDSTGKPITYYNWAAGEPENNGDVIFLNSNGEWGDSITTDSRYAICEEES